METPFTTRLSSCDPSALLTPPPSQSALLARAVTPSAVMRPLSRLTFSSVELLSALPSEPVAIANRLSAPARPATLTLGALLLPRLPSVGSTARGDVLLAVGVETAMPKALAVGVCAHAWAVGIAALYRRPRTRNPQAPPRAGARLF